MMEKYGIIHYLQSKDMGIILIGDYSTKRTDFFMEAAKSLNEEVTVMPYSNIDTRMLEGAVVKIDPPSTSVVDLEEENENLSQYIRVLNELKSVNCRFLNNPEDIQKVLDKYECKKILMDNNIPVSTMFLQRIADIEQLHNVMDESRINQVFIKPKFYSGAAGVVAYRRNIVRNKRQLFTSACIEKEHIINTKKLKKFENNEEIDEILENILKLDCVVEVWMPKANYKGMLYDLRVVWQFGRVEFMVARTSKGPITNLHLNNGAVKWEDIGLQEEDIMKINALCESAMKCFPGLNMAGIDIAFTKNMKTAYIIEINGQGDLIYQDIYNENIIYTNQVKEMKRWLLT